MHRDYPLDHSIYSPLIGQKLAIGDFIVARLTYRKFLGLDSDRRAPLSPDDAPF